MRASRTKNEGRRGPGRPREFDVTEAVDRALLVFRERGYHGASLAELGSAMGLSAGSIYKAFPDKRAIFLASLDRYLEVRSRKLERVMVSEMTGAGKLGALVRFYAYASCGTEGRRGCLIVGGAAELATFDATMAGRIRAALVELEERVCALIRSGQGDGSIARGIDVASTGRAVTCLLQGFRVLGQLNRSRAEMGGAADQAMRLVIGDPDRVRKARATRRSGTGVAVVPGL